MTALTEPRSGLSYGWTLGENDWNTGMDANLLKIGRVGMHLSVIDRDLTAPPGSPADGDAYIPAATATGDWATHEDEIAIYNADTSPGSWVFYTPSTGWVAYIEDEEVLSVYKEGSGVLWSAGVAI